jgi:1-acyl-sn-glycerol-3-phosphate acyltransferase
MARLRAILFTAPWVIFATIFFGSLNLFVSLFDAVGRTQLWLARVWARSILFVGGVRVAPSGVARIDPAAAYVIAANHASYIDTPVILSYIPVQFRFLAKSELFKIPFLGHHLKTAGHIPVPREDPRAALKTMTQAAENIRSKGISMLVFPEGGRTEDGELQAFKEGAAYIAIKAGVPVVPVALTGARAVLPRGSWVCVPGSIRIEVGEPIATDGLTLKDRDRVTLQIRQQIEALLRGSQPDLVAK